MSLPLIMAIICPASRYGVSVDSRTEHERFVFVDGLYGMARLSSTKEPHSPNSFIEGIRIAMIVSTNSASLLPILL